MPIDYERDLNPQQRAAVFHGEGPALVIAGAGTGKTRTLVYRVARLVETGVDPRRVLLLTFTRRAAQEMLRRAGALLNDERARQVSGGTFHSFAHAVLRRHAALAGIERNFTVLDRSDAEDIIQHLRTDLGFAGGKGDKGVNGGRRRFPKKRTLLEIFSKSVNTGTSVAETLKRDWPQFVQDGEKIIRLVERYTAYKRTHALLDYDDLLTALNRLLSQQAALRARIAERFRYTLVDEYQDTNRLQAEILRALAGQRMNVMAVGDDAQAIYSFRGADFRNIIEFPNDFPGATLYAIEENYRSTQPILDAANAVIARAAKRYEKELFTRRKGGAFPRLVGCADETAQAAYVADEILRYREEGLRLEDIAVLFRASYHSFELEAELARRNIPFVKYGGFKFAEAAHVKDAMAHLRWFVNAKDLVAAQRCLLILDGVGPVAARTIADAVAAASGMTEGLRAAPVPPRAQGQIGKLRAAFEAVARASGPSERLSALLPYLAETIAVRFDDHPKRLRDLEHLVAIARRFRSTERFVSDFSIDPPADHAIAGVEGVENEEEPLVLSTIHSAKGLEWRAVLVLSVLDGYLPQDYAFRSSVELEEERRLLYVAMTRAKEALTLTYPALVAPGGSAQAMLRSEMAFAKPSHFLDGISEEILAHAIVGDAAMFDGIRYEDDAA